MINKKINKEKTIIIMLFIIAVLFMTVGFALYGQTVSLGGTVTLKPQGKIYIKNVVYDSSQSNYSSAAPEWTDTTINFHMQFTTSSSTSVSANAYKAAFKITIKNDSFYDYIYTNPEYTHSIVRKDGNNYYAVDSSRIGSTVNGIKNGDKIEAGTEKTFTAIFTFTNPEQKSYTYLVDSEYTPKYNEDEETYFDAAVGNKNEGYLTEESGNTFDTFNIDVINTYKIDQNFSVSLNSDKYVIVGTSSFNISENNPGETFEFNVSKKDGVEYLSDMDSVEVLVSYAKGTIKAGKITIHVDKTNQDYVDTTPPKISKVEAVQNNENGSITVTWDGKDDVRVKDYTVIAYNSNGREVESHTVLGTAEEKYTFTGLSAGSYYFVVYGSDEAGNTGESYISSATTEEGEACRSIQAEYKWVYSAKVNASNLTYTGGGTSVNRGETYTVTFKGTGSGWNAYYPPNSLGAGAVKMGGKELSTAEYKYENSKLTIENVTGDLEINVSGNGGCLVEGTKILLADGKYKNIEDIKYTDLLKVYDHENGKTTEVYPIWIEKFGVAQKYTEITFSDGSNLKVVNSHCLFDVDKKKYVDVLNDKEFKVGSRVYKLNNDKLEIVAVTKIEDKFEEVKYYNIVSTKYYNIIANNLLTTDPTSSISNVYGFESNAIYSKNYHLISNLKGLEYEDINDIPYYLYKGLNLRNAKLLVNLSLDTNFLSTFVKNRTVDQITKNGERYFMVTTSLDKVNDSNKENYLFKEGSTYIVPNGAKCFVETSSGKMYFSGDKITVEYSIHFKGIN